MAIVENLRKFQEELGENISLVAVSKTKPTSDIQLAYESGHRDFGENKVQELQAKADILPKDIKWHMIGHLQSNKVKYIAPFVSLIHGVDKLKLLAEINKRASQHNRVIDVLLQVHIAEEENKFGLNQEELIDILESTPFSEMKNIKVRGLMGMATNTDNQNQIRKEFEGLKSYFDQIRNKYFEDNLGFDILSMGMSGDYRIAIESGSNMVRIGSSIFGSRSYT